MFPTVMFVFNVSSVAVLWFGAGPVDDGSLQIGSLTAFLSYLMQILMAVMMATFVGVLAPRAAVSADRIGEVLDHDVVGRPAAASGHRRRRARAASSFATSRSTTPAPSSPVLRGVSFAVGPGQTTAIIGSTGAGKTTLVNLIPRLFDVTGGAVLVDGVDVRDLDPGRAVEPHRYGPAGRLPVQRHDRQQPALRAARRHRRRDVGRPRRSPRPPTSCGRCPTAWRRPSPRAARTCRVASASAWRSPGR